MTPNIEIVPFTPERFNDYLRLYEPYFIRLDWLNKNGYIPLLSQTGFMVGEPHESWEEQPPLELGLCAVVNNKVVGIIRIDKADSDWQDGHSSLGWNNCPQLEAVYNQEAYVEFGVILIDDSFAHQGVGSALFKRAKQILAERGHKHLFSFVVSNPIWNEPSMRFHKKQGFQHVATFHAPLAFGMPDYQSHMFHLDLNPTA